MLGLAIGDPGDGILVSRPVYGRFELDFGNTAGLEIVYADMRGQDPFVGEKEVVERFEKGLQEARERGVNVKAVLIVNPHNPLGKVAGSCFDEIDRKLADIVRSLLSRFDAKGSDGFCTKISNPPNQRRGIWTLRIR